MRTAWDFLLLAVVGGALLSVPSAQAHHSCRTEIRTVIVRGAAQSTAVRVCAPHVSQAEGGGEAGERSRSVSDEVSERGQQVVDAACRASALALGVSPEEYCVEEAIPGAALTPAAVSTAFRSLRLPPSRLQIQPPARGPW